MAPVVSQLIEEATLHAQSDILEDARKICADGTYFPNNLRILLYRNQRSADFPPLNCNDIMTRENFALYLCRPIIHSNWESRY